MRKHLIVICAVFALFGYVKLASADLIISYNDLYLHPKDNEVWQRGWDIITPPHIEFDLKKIDVYADASSLVFEIFTQSFLNDSSVVSGTAIGDLFVYSSGSSVIAIALRDHGQPAGATKVALLEGGDGIKKGNIFSPIGYRMSEAYFIPPFSTQNIGDNEIATAWGEVVDQASIFYDGLGMIRVTYLWDNQNYREDALKFRFHLTQTCGNDVFDNQVPEPATMLLLGSGLLGMGVYARRRFRK